MGWIPGLGRSLMSRNNLAGALQQEKAPQGEARTPQPESSPELAATRESPQKARRPSTAKKKVSKKEVTNI